MNKKDHFDELFTSRLRDQESKTESWNTPSENVWLNAKIHFPKPRRKRRFFIILFPLLGLLTATLFLFNTYDVKVVSDMGSNLFNETETNTTSNFLSQSREIQSESKKPFEVGSHKIENSTNQASEFKGETKKVVTNLNTNNLESNKTPPNSQIIITSDIASSSSSLKSEWPVNPFLQNKQATSITENKEAQEGWLQKQTGMAQKKANNGELLTAEKKNIAILEKRIPTENIIIPSISILPFDTNINKPVAPAPRLIKIKRRPSPYRWAIGFNTSRFFENPFLDFDEPNENTINTNYSIINLSLALQTGNQTSITTGLSVLNSTINIGSEFIETYDANQPSESLASNIAASSQVGVLSINGNESAIMINFLPDVQLSNGDLLAVMSNIPLKIKAYSIPIIYKRQFLMNRFTPYLLGGLSIDFFDINLEEIFLDIRFRNQIIHEPVTIDPIREFETVGSLFLGFGTQYNINERWYGEVGLVTDLFDIKFTRIEAGISYRF